MFQFANEREASRRESSFAVLQVSLDRLEKTAKTWFDGGSDSIQERREALYQAENACYRAASFAEGDEAERIYVIADNLVEQHSKLASLEREIANEEYEGRLDKVAFSDREDHFSDESHTAARLTTDWDAYLAIEPRIFVANNRDADKEELQLRAVAFIENATYGHGMSRQAKREIAEDFLTEVSHLHKPMPTKKVAAKAQLDQTAADTLLFF